MNETEVKTYTWHKMGLVLEWLMEQELTPNERDIYNVIVMNTIGYNQYLSDFLSYEKIMKLTKIKRTTIIKTIKDLIEKKYIVKVATNKIANTGKLPYKYYLNMKLKDFPSLGKLKSNREDKQKQDNILDDKKLEKLVLLKQSDNQEYAKTIKQMFNNNLDEVAKAAELVNEYENRTDYVLDI